MVVDSVEFAVRWPPRKDIPATDRPLLDNSLGRLAIKIGEDIATRFRTDHNAQGDELLIPTYGLAEWIAENWWPLLYEPPKRENYQDDPDYRARHWLGAARDGFALPDLWFCPGGDKMQIVGEAAQLRFARLSFLVEIADAAAPIPVVRAALRNFIERVLTRLDELGQRATALHQLWRAIRETGPEAERYCELIGALGLSPYDDHPEMGAVLDQLSDRLDSALVQDLCNTADSATFPALAQLTRGIAETLDAAAAPEARLGDLLAVPVPSDDYPHAWQWGLAAVDRVRRQFKIANADPEGGERFLTALELGQIAPQGRRQTEQIDGGLRRRDDRLRLAVFDEPAPQQRFTTTRAAFLGWLHGGDGAHLVTSALTRDQQASRAFAAEMLAPIAYIRTRATNRVLSDYRVDEIAQALNAPAGAIRHRARRGGIHVLDARGGWG
jgi:hypothetical protein